MDIKRIQNALHEDGGAAASGTSATPGIGAIGGGVAGYKAPMGAWRKENEEVDPQAPGVVQSTQHASGAQLSNPMRETEEVVNLFDEERIAFSEMPLTPFSGLQMGDLEVGINKLFDQVAKIVDYNISNTTDPTNTNVESLKTKYDTLKNQAIQKVERVIGYLEDGNVDTKEKEINLGDIFLVMSLINAYTDNDGVDPKVYAKKQGERLLQIARDDALELIGHLYKTLIHKISPSTATLMSMADETIDAIRKDQWAEALVWNKLRKTVEQMKIVDTDNDFDTELPPVEPEEEPEEHSELEPVAEMEGSGTKTGCASQSSSDVTPVQASGMQSKCPSFPLQGNQAIHEEDAPPQNEIQPLALGDISIEGYFVIENNKPTLIRYKVVKGGAPMPVDPKKANSEDIGHTKEQVLKKLSMMPQKVPFIRKFLTYNKTNETTLKTKQQEKMG